MGEILTWLFGAASFVPHGYCLLWRPDLVALHASSDVLIALAYFSIPLALFHFQRRRTDLQYRWLFRLFALFIFACGTTHVIGLVSLWYPVYGLQGLVKAITATVSVATAISIWPIIPQAIALPSPAQLTTSNERLSMEIRRREAIQHQLERARVELETRVVERTGELAEANERLAAEVAERRRAEEGTRRALDRLRRFVTNTPLAVIEAALPLTENGGWRVRHWSGQAESIFGWSETEATGLTLEQLELVMQEGPEERPLASLLVDEGETRGAATVGCRTRDGATRHCRWYVSILPDDVGAGDNALILVEDVTDRILAQRSAERLAHHDPLTDLPNRVLFQDRLEQALARARRLNEKVGVMLIDLDRFKEVNDTLGHGAGDKLLCEIGRRLSSMTRETDTLARLGGDEFALVQVGISDSAGAATLGRRVLHALSGPFEIDGHQLDVTASIGITLFPDDADAPDRLVQNADMALYRAKNAGRACYEFYRPEMEHAAQSRRRLQRGLKLAIETEALEVAYQPIVELCGDTIVQYEALLRWPQSGAASIPPTVFVPIAETTGLILPLGAFVLRAACGEAALWREAGSERRVCVNLSAAQLREHELVAQVYKALQDTGLPPDLLELELTESVFLDPSKDAILGRLRRIADLGVTIAVDDFGTGYSSLGCLKHFPFSTIKIDGSFVRDIGRDGDAEAIVTAVIALGHNLGKTVVAEGVETAEQLAFLRAHRCDLAQGYLLGRPGPAPRLLPGVAAGEVSRLAVVG